MMVLASNALHTAVPSPGSSRRTWQHSPDLILLPKDHPLYEAVSRYKNTSGHHLTVVDTRAVWIRDKRSGTERLVNWPVDEDGNTLHAAELATRINAGARHSVRPSVIMSCPLDPEYLQALAQHLGVEVRNPPQPVWVHERIGSVGAGELPPTRNLHRLVPRPVLRVFSPKEEWAPAIHELVNRPVSRYDYRTSKTQRSEWRHLGSEQFPEQHQWYKKTDRGLQILVGPLSPNDVNTAYPTRILSEIKPGMRVLDVGCGYGQFVRDLRTRGADAVGVDPQEELPTAPYLFNVDLQSAGFDENSFDIILSAHSIFNYSESSEFRLAALQKMADLLKPGGKIVLGAVTGAMQLANFVETGQVGSLKVLSLIPEYKVGNGTHVSGYVEFVKQHSNEREMPRPALGHSASSAGEASISIDLARALINGALEQLSSAKTQCSRGGDELLKARDAVYAGTAVPIDSEDFFRYLLGDVEATADANIPQLVSALEGSAHESLADLQVSAIKEAGLAAKQIQARFLQIVQSYDQTLTGDAKTRNRDDTIHALSELEDKLRDMESALGHACQFYEATAARL
ncbi:class I SAM-dependent methyltransferase [Trinickia sp. LjRoot230]|uniref:class I SAM-dependent methyltransferase n=1 Tax=Trinickia sp. LjRoot230 TaxID=3342288 RepID=UPI003ECCB0B0